MASRIARSLVPLAAVAAALALLEAGLWALGLFEPIPRYAVGEGGFRQSPRWMEDPSTGWRLLPNRDSRPEARVGYRTNAQGFRANHDFDPADPRFKIVLAGDSFSFGYGARYEETFPVLLDESLPGAVVFNLAMPGFGVDQIYLSLRDQGLGLNPQLMIAAISDVDFARSQTAYRGLPEQRRKPAFKLVDGKLEPKTPADRMNPAARLLERRSRVWMGLRLAARAIGYQVPIGEWWTLNRAILDEIRRLGREKGVPVLFVYVPTAQWRSFPTLSNYMKSAEASYINLREGFSGEPATLYLPDDGHFNAEGHRYVAGRLEEWIRERSPQAKSSR